MKITMKGISENSAVRLFLQEIHEDEEIINKVFRGTINTVKVIFLLACLIFSISARSQYQNLEIKNISTKEGLSSNKTLTVLQDYRGFIWIGTEYGLNRYDGYEMTVFTNIPDDGSWPVDNAVYSLLEDADNRLFVGTQRGINYFDSNSETLIPVSLVDDKGIDNATKIIAICQDKTGNYWIGLQHFGLLLISNNLQQRRVFKYSEDKEQNTLNHLQITSSGKILVATEKNGILEFNPKTETFSSFYSPMYHDGFSEDYIRYFYLDSRNSLWIAQHKGVICTSEKSLNRINNKSKIKTYLSNSSALHIAEDSKGLIWISTRDSGIYKFDCLTGEVQNYSSKTFQGSNLRSDFINMIYFDNTNNMWICTYDKGIDFSPAIKNPFVHFSHIENNKNSLSNNSVLSVCEDNDGNLWIGTDGGGLNMYNKQKDEFIHYLYNPGKKNTICSNHILFVFKDSKDQIWASGYLAGLSKFNSNQNNFVNFSLSKSPFKNPLNNDIRDIVEDMNGNFWIATNGGGLHLFDPEKGRVLKNYIAPYSNNDSLLVSNYCLKLLHFNDTLLCIGTYNGLSVFNIRTEAFRNYWDNKNIDNNMLGPEIYTMHLADANSLYFGTSQGLNLFELITDFFTSGKQNNKFPTGVINGIIEDSRNNLWISSYNSIIKFNTDTVSVHRYDPGGRTSVQEFNHGAYCKTHSGEMIFGGTNGFVIFHPDSIKKNKTSPDIEITDFLIFNKSVKASPNSFLKKSIGLSDTIIITYNESVISFKYAALNYIHPEKNQYAYKMEGYDERWNYVGNSRIATYTGIPPGEYTFRVIASNNDDIWNTQGQSVVLIVLPPFWKTWWFRTLGAVCIILLLSVLYYSRMKLLKDKNRELEVKVEERTHEISRQNQELLNKTSKLNKTNKLLKERQIYIQKQSKKLLYQKNQLEELNTTKDRLFSIIGHDLRNPFGNVLGLTEILKEDYNDFSDEERLNLIKNIRSSSKSIYNLLENLLRWAGAHQDRIQFSPVFINLHDIIKENIELVKNLANEKNIRIGFDPQSKDIQVYSDRNILDAILRNLLSNAIKFTFEGGKIHIFIEDNEKFVMVNIEDSGVGISNEVLTKIFSGNIFEPAFGTNYEKGIGLGISICREFAKKQGGEVGVLRNKDSGSTFYFTIPKKPLPDISKKNVDDTGIN